MRPAPRPEPPTNGTPPSTPAHPAMEPFIGFFARRHLLANLIFACVILGGIFSWHNTNKEELPSITANFVRVSVSYPGAPAEDVEYFVTRPLEEKIRGLDGVFRIESTSGVGSSSVRVELERDYPKMDEAVMEIRNAALDVRYPEDVVDDPSIRVFQTDKKAILDIGIYHKDVRILDKKSRLELQKIAFALENRLLAMPQVHSVDRNAYLREELQVRVKPDQLLRYKIPFNTVLREVRANHVRQPAGTIEAQAEPKVTLLSELDSPARLSELAIQGGFEGQVIRLDQVAEIEAGFEKNSRIVKVNGHEGVLFSVVKSPSHGILETLDAVDKALAGFRKSTLKDSPVVLTKLDDESLDVRNRLRLITVNGAIGFALIMLTLFVFLDKRAAFWVAMGIPFTFCATMIGASWLGHTINGTTLAAVIIVMGIVVDDAIVVAENIAREIQKGVKRSVAVVRATAYVTLPITASIATTIVAFVPLYFFEGRFGRFIVFIPPIIILMLMASLFESLFILPSHMGLGPKDEEGRGHWFERVEDAYGRMVERALRWKWLVLAGMTGILLCSFQLMRTKMKFVMFPNEETRDISISGYAPKGFTRYQTARKVQEIEDLLTPYLGKEGVAFRTQIAQSRGGGSVEQNAFRILFEIVPRDKREKSADDITGELEAGFAKLEGYTKLRFRKSRWGQESGSPIEILIQENSDKTRRALADDLLAAFREHPLLANPEIEEGFFTDEYRIRIDREKIKRLAISPSDVSSTFRAALEGIVVYEFSNGDEEVRVRLTTVDSAKTDIGKVLAIPVENQRNYLVPLRDIVSVEKVVSPTSIQRRDLKRTTKLFADLKEGVKATPLEAAEAIEEDIFPGLLARYPTANVSFTGEVEDTREAGGDFRNAALLALLLIYVILAVLFDAVFKPLVIMTAIPFAVAGVILAFLLHGKVLFGFYAAVGVLGLAGVVVNDSIVMLVKLEDEFRGEGDPAGRVRRIAEIAKTRLRAVLLTTLTTVAGVLPTAYGLAGYDAMLADMMLALSWGLVFGTVIILFLVPCLYSIGMDLKLVRPPAAEPELEPAREPVATGSPV